MMRKTLRAVHRLLNVAFVLAASGLLTLWCLSYLIEIFYANRFIEEHLYARLADQRASIREMLGNESTAYLPLDSCYFNDGVIHVEHKRALQMPAPDNDVEALLLRLPSCFGRPPKSTWKRQYPGIQLSSSVSANDIRRTLVVVDLWLPFVVIALYPAVGLLVSGHHRVRQSLRRRGNQCIKCGYSLVGNVSGICPECGREV